MAESTREAAILAALKGASAQKPMDYGTLTRKLADAGHVLLINELMDELDDLLRRRAVNTAQVSRDGGQSFVSVCWPTGVAPAPFNAFRSPIKAYTEADAAAAHAAQAAAEASRATVGGSDSLKSPPAPLYERGEKNQENSMPRITRPAQSKLKAANGSVQAEILAAVRGKTRDAALTLDEVLPLCPSAASIGSLRGAARILIDRGQLGMDSRKARGKLRYHVWDARAGLTGQAAPGATMATESRRRNTGEYPAGQARLSFSIHDDGSLTVFDNQDPWVLTAEDTRRLAAFLLGATGIIHRVGL